MNNAVECRSLSRSFKGNARQPPIIALDNINLDVREGELFGLLGPNGAGKTTLIKILATLLLPSSGKVTVLGYDVEREAHKIRPLINMVSGGEISGYGLLTVKENLWMFSQFYGIPSKIAKRRVDELLHEFALVDKANAKVRTISTGQRQRMNVVRGFVTDPDLIFLDEPTLGLDVNSSRTIRDYIRRWVRGQKGKTALITTHYMMEAEELCDRVAIIDRGRILACDSPHNLKKQVQRDAVFTLETTQVMDLNWFGQISGVKGYSCEINGEHQKIRIVTEEESVLAEVIQAIAGKGVKVLSLTKAEPTLEDVFLQLVGRGLV
ncbi:MAG: ABC transporter ATP-binding protein [Methanomassiliicoccales archaeon]|jgi:ABC-2 type transport system ATP-binding protein|nr:ABC transporter ATP-binding protein [Methanomassiliicoccales archaeon]